jgi:hypothetical protein
MNMPGHIMALALLKRNGGSNAPYPLELVKSLSNGALLGATTRLNHGFLPVSTYEQMPYRSSGNDLDEIL